MLATTCFRRRYRLLDDNEGPAPEGLDAVSRHRKTFAARHEQRKGDTAMRSLITCETNPTRQSRRDEKARESGQIVCNCNRSDALSRFLRLSRWFCTLALASSISLLLTFVTSLLFLHSLTYHFLYREDQRPAMRETNDPRFLNFSFFFSSVSLFERNRFHGRVKGRCIE